MDSKGVRRSGPAQEIGALDFVMAAQDGRGLDRIDRHRQEFLTEG
jgi:hypothetical protein